MTFSFSRECRASSDATTIITPQTAQESIISRAVEEIGSPKSDSPQTKGENTISSKSCVIDARSALSEGLLRSPHLNLNLQLGDLYFNVLPSASSCALVDNSCVAESKSLEVVRTTLRSARRGLELLMLGDSKQALVELRAAERGSRLPSVRSTTAAAIDSAEHTTPLQQPIRQQLLSCSNERFLHKQRVSIQHNYAIALCINGKPRLALEAFNDILATVDANSSTGSIKTDAFNGMHQTTSQHKEIVHNARGVANLYCSRFESAMRDFSLSIEASEGTYASAYSNRATLYLHKQQWLHAISDFEASVFCDVSLAKGALPLVKQAVQALAASTTIQGDVEQEVVVMGELTSSDDESVFTADTGYRSEESATARADQ